MPGRSFVAAEILIDTASIGQDYYEYVFCLCHALKQTNKEKPEDFSFQVAPSDIISKLFLEDLDRIRELKKWIPNPCNPYLHYLNPNDKEVI